MNLRKGMKHGLKQSHNVIMFLCLLSRTRIINMPLPCTPQPPKRNYMQKNGHNISITQSSAKNNPVNCLLKKGGTSQRKRLTSTEHEVK